MSCFRDIPGFPRYRVNEEGLFQSFRAGDWRPLGTCMKNVHGKEKKRNRRIAFVNLWRDRKRHDIRVARLVLEVFVGPPPPGMQACHRDDNSANNKLENLYWGTPVQNKEDARRNDRIAIGVRNGNSALSESEVIQIRKRVAAGETKRGLAREYGVTPSAIRHVVKMNTWKHV